MFNPPFFCFFWEKKMVSVKPFLDIKKVKNNRNIQNAGSLCLYFTQMKGLANVDFRLVKNIYVVSANMEIFKKPFADC
jgi:hypothetical protein